VVIKASAYGMSSSASPEINRVALDAVIAASVLAGTPFELPEATCQVGPRRSAGYCIKSTSGFKMYESPFGSRILQVGDAGGVSNQLFQLTGGSDYVFGLNGGLTLDGSGVINPYQDQNHLVNALGILGPITNITFNRVTFTHAGSGALNTGDGFRSVGGVGKLITGILFDRCHFNMCGRSGISPNYGTKGMTVLDSTFVDTSDQHFDIESSGVLDIEDLVFKRCRFGKNRTGFVAVSLGGNSPAALVRNVLFEDCKFDGSGVFQMAVTEDVTLRRCSIKPFKEISALGSIHFFGYNKNFLVEDCEVERYAEQGNNVPVVSAFNYSGLGPDGVTFKNTKLTQYGNKSVMELFASDNVLVEDCNLQYKGTTNNTYYGIWFRSILKTITSARVVNTKISGVSGAKLSSGVTTTPDTSFNLGGIDVDNCTIEESSYGLTTIGLSSQYNDEPIFRAPVLGAGVSYLSQSSVSAPAVVVAGNRGTTNERALSGWGTPEAVITAPVGSSYFRRETSRYYYKNSGTGNTGWVLI
jgi:hypothetical protein